MPNLTKDGFRQSAPERRGESAERMKRAELVSELARWIKVESFARKTWPEVAEAILTRLEDRGLCIAPKPVPHHAVDWSKDD